MAGVGVWRLCHISGVDGEFDFRTAGRDVPEVPPDNNTGDRRLRPVAVSRKVSGGTCSEQDTDTNRTLASIFSACFSTRFSTRWAEGLNPFTARRQLPASPQLRTATKNGPAVARCAAYRRGA